MSNFTIASILNLPKLTPNCPPPSCPQRGCPPRVPTEFPIHKTPIFQRKALNSPIVYGDYNDNDIKTDLEHIRDEPRLEIDQSETVDLNQNKKKRGRKKGSKNRPKEIIEAEKQNKRRKSDSEGPKIVIARKKSLDPQEALAEAPNLPTNGETCENEFLCGWCKKLFSSPVGRMRHSMHCNWNPDRINKLKAKRKKSKEENEAPRRPKKWKLPIQTTTDIMGGEFRTIPLFENGIQFGKKLVPNGVVPRGITSPFAAALSSVTNIKLENDSTEQMDDSSGDENDDVPLTSILNKTKIVQDFTCPKLEPNVKLEMK